MAMQRPEKASRHAAIQGLSPKERSPGQNRRQKAGRYAGHWAPGPRVCMELEVSHRVTGAARPMMALPWRRDYPPSCPTGRFCKAGCFVAPIASGNGGIFNALKARSLLSR